MRCETTACILCSRNCGLAVEVADGQFLKIRGDEKHPVSKGYLCQKAARLAYYQDLGDRLSHPLRRQADGSFERVSWDEALDDIARRLVAIRDQHGGNAFATVGGGGQGNHLGAAYLGQIRAAMKSHFAYNSLGQEKTGDFWVNGRLFGSQRCHTTEDVEHAELVLFLGCNPYQSHGIPNARHTLRELQKDPKRTMIVIDPRRTETAELADLHLQLKPGTDAFLLSGMLATIVQEGLHDRPFLANHCTGFERIESHLRQVSVEACATQADVPLADIVQAARAFATAKSACVRVDLGIQHTLHSTLNSYLEKLLFLITGNFACKGGNNLHSSLIPVLGHTDERNPRFTRTAYHQMFPIAGIYPPNILPDEILKAGEQRIRAVIVDSSNPLLTWPDSKAYASAFSSLELLVVVDVALTETAKLAHYVLPAASQFEKWEFTGFNLEFPVNAFHLRHPLFEPYAESRPEPEVYTSLLEKMGELPRHFPLLRRLARFEPAVTAHLAFVTVLTLFLALRKKLRPYVVSVLYRTLGAALPDGAAAAALLLPLAMMFAAKNANAVRRAGHRGLFPWLGTRLFRTILARRSGVVFSEHRYDDVWSMIKHRDGRIHLEIPEMLEAWANLATEPQTAVDYPFVLVAGERRSYNANQIYRNPAWRKTDPHGAMRIHPLDAEALRLRKGEEAWCESRHGRIKVVIAPDDTMRRGVLMLPHGYGSCYKDQPPTGPALNLLTSSGECDPLARTPYHKYLPVRLRIVASEEGPSDAAIRAVPPE